MERDGILIRELSLFGFMSQYAISWPMPGITLGGAYDNEL